MTLNIETLREKHEKATKEPIYDMHFTRFDRDLAVYLRNHTPEILKLMELAEEMAHALDQFGYDSHGMRSMGTAPLLTEYQALTKKDA